MIRRAISEIVGKGIIPSEATADEEQILWLESALDQLELPLSNEEASALAEIFGDDTCFGIAWTILHAIETSPDPVYTSDPGPSANEWQRRLWERASRLP